MERVLQTVRVKTDTKWPLTEHVSIARYKTWQPGTITKFVRLTGLMHVAVSAAGQIGTSTKTAAVIVHYVNRLKCSIIIMIAYVRMGMIAVRRVAAKRKRALTARLVVQRRKSVRTKCLPFVAPMAKPASTEVVVRRRMRMRRNVVLTVSEQTELVVQLTQPPAPTVQPLTITDAWCVRTIGVHKQGGIGRMVYVVMETVVSVRENV